MKRIKSYSLITAVLLIVGQLNAQTIEQKVGNASNSSGKSTSTTFALKATAGQPAIGMSTSTSFDASAGFENQNASGKTYDLSFENLVIAPTIVGPGNDIAISVDIKNLGDGAITGSSFGIGVYLSSDQVIDSGEELTTITIAGDIAGGATYNFPQATDVDDVTIPAATNAGTYFIILGADNGDLILETDETNNEANTALTITDDANPPVLANFTGVSLFSTGSTVSVSATDNVGVDLVNFYHRGITTPETQGWGTPEVVTSTSGVYSIELQGSWLDNLGVEYWFEAFDSSNNKDSTGIEYTYFQTPGGELNFPNLKKGRTVADYEMISVPFDLADKSPKDIFSAFGPYVDTEWRMYHYTGGSTKEYNQPQEWSQMELGKSYWIINDVAGASTIQIGEGDGPSSNKQSPYTMNLVQGWNQIGNPYRFDVTWADIMTASGDPVEAERFRIWSNGSWSDGTTLETFGGGFVFTSAPVTLSIPVTPPVSSSTEQQVTAARLKNLKNPIDAENWEVDFHLSNEEIEFIFGGLGMRVDANVSKDIYDEVGSPRFIEYLEMNFDHPEYFIPRFSKDVVPPSDNFQWEFEVESKSRYVLTTLSWDNSYFGDNELQLYLFDEVKQRFVNMREVNSYTFSINEKHEFKVFYGDIEYIENELNPSRILLGNNYPNPFVNNTAIPFTLPPSENSYRIELRVYNQMGKEVNSLLKGTYQQGFYEVEWNRNDRYGQRVPAGIYLYYIIVTDNERKVIQTGKMAVN